MDAVGAIEFSDEYIKQKKIDELYHRVWGLLDEVNGLKREILEIGEAMKEVVSDDVFKLGYKE
jgi:hypothetical protein